MTGDQEAGQGPATKWGAFGAGAVAATVVAAVVLAVVDAVSANVAAGAVQLVGIGLTLLGVEVVRSSLEQAAEKAVAAKRGLDRLLALRQEQFRRWRARRRGRPVVVSLSGTLAGTGSMSGTLTIVRSRVDRETISDREWLAFLDDRVETLFERLDQSDKAREAVHEDLVRRLADERDHLRDEMLDATRKGWELIIAGLVCSAVGTAVGIAT
jgi:hypothetical protein